MTAPATLEAIRDLDAGVAFPGYALEGCETALILFAAGFLGKQDACWIADAGLRAVCVDEDGDKLDEMREMYPGDWTFDRSDVFEFADDARAERLRWDVVSLDPWTQDFDKCAARIGVWCSLARKAVILGTGVNTKVTAPEGWRVSETRRRSDYDGGVFWTVLERA